MCVMTLILSLQSPADQCKKIHAGDEVIQVNHQTVVSLNDNTEQYLAVSVATAYEYQQFVLHSALC